MARGRPPKPVEQRRLEGGSTVSHRPLPEPLLVAGRPELQKFAEPPPGLPEDAKEFWADSVVKLAEVGVLDLVDTPALEMLATQYARVLQARRVIAAKGLFALGSVGQVREAPWVRLERDAMAAFMRMASEFALTPVARTRLGLAQLHGKAMAKELEDAIGGGQGPVDATVVEDDGDVGLPGV
jgi:P27 family predicted phage terminase small subunit